MGQADFITAMAQHGLVPSAEEMLHCSPFMGRQPVFSEEFGMFRRVWDLQTSTNIVAAEIAKSRAQMIAENAHILNPAGAMFSPTHQGVDHLRRLRELLNNTWTSRMDPPLVNAIREGTLSDCSQAILEAVSLSERTLTSRAQALC